jgi:hypothetical protein
MMLADVGYQNSSTPRSIAPGRVMYGNDLTLPRMKPIFDGLAVEGYR